MRRAIPAVLLSATGLVMVWQFEPAAPAVASPSSAHAGDATVTGTREAIRQGTVQVQVVFSGTRIADVVVLQAPDTGPTRHALPLLREMTLRAQSAQIDTVTGATMTSQAYRSSLQAAIDGRGSR
jgi:uncharacterized protein with FMN-binding domain